MSELCPHCNRVAQKVSEKCLYCGKPLSGASSAKPPAEVAPGHGSNGSKENGAAALTTPPPGERRLDMVGGGEADAGTARTFTVTRPAPADAARRAAPSGGGFLKSPVGAIAVFLIAAVMVIIAISVATEEDDSQPVVIRPAPVEDAGALIAEGMMPDEAQPAPDAVATVAAADRNQAGFDALVEVIGWIERYADQYGHYPSYLGDNLEAVAAYASPAAIEAVLSRFADGRIAYDRSATAGGSEETVELTATVRGSGGMTLTRSTTRARGVASPGTAP